MVVTCWLYSYLTLELIGSILEKPKLKKYQAMMLSAVNTAAVVFFVSLQGGNTVFSYVVAGVVLFTEFYFFHGDTILRAAFVTLSCTMHIMVVRAVCVAAISLSTGFSLHVIVTQPHLLAMSTSITFLLIDLAIFAVLKLISPDKIKIINQHKEQLYFMISWLVVFNLSILANAEIYNLDVYQPAVGRTQIIVPLSILAGLYIVLFFAFQTSTLLGYKKKNSELENEIHLEQQYRDSMVSDSLYCYEVNLSRDLVLSWLGEGEHPQQGGGYDEAVRQVVETQVHPNDRASFINAVRSDKMIAEFLSGKREISVEFRCKPSPKSGYIWMRATNNLVRDTANGDVKALTYIKDIDQEKRMQIDLKYKAERDSLTGLYNKGTTARLISEHLQDCRNGALLIVDVDDFKNINDSLGHTFGDAVLCEMGEKLRGIFRDDDIVGRIGGDEYIAFMKSVCNMQAVESKAMQICESFRNTYQGLEHAEYSTSGSIGIAVFPEHGATFEGLYKNADVALYAAKNQGKNTYKLYTGEKFETYTANRTDIDSSGIATRKNFKDNRIEYVFKILYGSSSTVSAVHSVLELLAAHFSFSRGYIFENSKDGLTTSNTFEWCAANIEPQIDHLQNLQLSLLSNAVASFQQYGFLVLNHVDELADAEREILEPQKIKSMFQFGMFDANEWIGFVGFDDCTRERTLTEEQMDELSTLCNVLATFLVKQRTMEKEASNARFLHTIMQNWDSYAYIVERDTFRFLFLNEKTKHILGGVKPGDCCYQVVRGKSAPCDDCPIKNLTGDPSSRSTQIIYNERLNIWLESTATNIVWDTDLPACLINCIDVTKYYTDSH